MAIKQLPYSYTSHTSILTNSNKPLSSYLKQRAMASAAAVASSSNEALATPRPVKSEIMV